MSARSTHTTRSTRPARDHERQRTYDAEAHAFTDTVYEVSVGLFALEVLTGRLAKALGDTLGAALALRLSAIGVVDAAPTARRSTADVANLRIKVAHGMDTVATLCHELAHFLVPGEGHTPAFRGAVVELTRLACGDDLAVRLRSAFTGAGLAVEAWPSTPVVVPPGGISSDLVAGVQEHDAEVVRQARKVQALLAKATSTASHHEAEALRAKALELSTRHGISRAHVEAAAHEEAAGLVERCVRLGGGPYAAARYELLAALATARCCEVLWRNDAHGRVVYVMGHRSDVLDVEALFTTLDHQARLEVLAAPAVGNTLQFRRSWLFGFAREVAAKLAAAERAAVRDADRAASAKGEASTALVLAERRERVRDFRKVRHPRVRSVGVGGGLNSAGYEQGRVAGRKVNLSGGSLPSGRRSLASGT